MPSICDNYRAVLGNVVDALSSLPGVFFVVPPPPSLGIEYKDSITYLIGQTSPNVCTRLEFQGRTLFSYGFIGTKLNQHEAKNGDWTRAGLHCVKKFLYECLGLHWAFTAKEDDDGRVKVPKPKGKPHPRNPISPLRPSSTLGTQSSISLRQTTTHRSVSSGPQLDRDRYGQVRTTRVTRAASIVVRDATTLITTRPLLEVSLRDLRRAGLITSGRTRWRSVSLDALIAADVDPKGRRVILGI